MKPKARQGRLVIRKFESDLVVYDLDAHCAQRLNPTAAFVFTHADGTRTIHDLAESLSAELGVPVDDQLVEAALELLDEGALLEQPSASSIGSPRLDRRAAFKRLGLVGATAMLIPAVEALAVPAAASARTTVVKSYGQIPQ